MDRPHEGNTAPPGTPLAGEVIVVLEDDELVRRATERMLRRFGAEVIGAGSSEEALRMLSERGLTPATVVADYWLNNNESGLQAVDRLRRATGAAPRGIIITGDVSAATAEEVAGAGFCLLRKPVAVDRFVDVLARQR